MRLLSHRARRRGLLAPAAVCAALWALSALAPNAAYGAEGALAPPARDCGSGMLYAHYDGSFETYYMYDNSENQPYNGSYGEAYDPSPGTIHCAVFWLTSVQPFEPVRTYVYIWEGGAAGEPGSVLDMIPDVLFDNVGIYPEFGPNVVPIDFAVSGDFTVGYWSGSTSPWTCAAVGGDTDGMAGNPWVYGAPYPGGDPSWVSLRPYGTKSLGIGIYFAPATPVRETSWGAIKSLYR